MSAETFGFEIHGKKYTIPTYQNIPMRALRRALEEEDRIKQSFIIIENTVKEQKTLDAIEDMTVAEFVAFIEAWSSNDEASLGD
jgi:hypothetical protein